MKKNHKDGDIILIEGKEHEISSFEHRHGHKIFKIRIVYTRCQHCGSAIPKGKRL